MEEKKSLVNTVGETLQEIKSQQEKNYATAIKHADVLDAIKSIMVEGFGQIGQALANNPQLEVLEKNLAEKEELIASLQKEVAEKTETIQGLEKKVSDYETEMGELEKAFSQY